MKRLLKLTFREIYKSFNRFIAIFLIVALGTGFLAGLLATTPAMRRSIDSYYKQHNFMDLRLVSTFGFNADDIAAVKNIEGVKNICAVFSKDVKADIDSDKFVARIESLPLDISEQNENYINRLELSAGRMPENKGECVIQAHGMVEGSDWIGKTVTVTGEESTFGEETVTFTVVGTVTSARYFSIENETTNVGSGNVGLFVYTTEDAFSLEVKTDIFLTLELSKKAVATSERYFDEVEEFADKIPAVSEVRIDARYEEYREELEKAIADGKAELADKRAEAEKTFADTQKQFDKAVKKLDSTSETLKAARKALNAQYEEYNKLVSASKSKYEAAKAENDAETLRIAEELAALDTAAPDYTEKYEALLAEAEQLRLESEGLLAIYDAEVAALEPMKTELDKQNSTLSKNENAYLYSVDELNENYYEFLKEKAKAEEEFKKAEGDIANIEELLETSAKPEWYILGRDQSISASSYASNVEKINAIAKIFPVFFFFIAAFVALTTMTRMVEEQRGQIGTLKALGYSDSAVRFKYCVYAAAATVGGSAVGLSVGFKLFPSIIWGAYSILYDLPDLLSGFDLFYATAAFATMAICTVGATVIACASTLKTSPSTLFLPKAPAPGKRVLLERIGFIWKLLSFSKKVTVRNLFRYKKRFILTVAGIAGCTALLVTGFGLNDSIDAMIPRQFDMIYKYNLTVGLEEGSDSGDTAYAKVANILYDNGVMKFMRMGNENVEVSAGSTVIDSTLTAPEDAANFKHFVMLRERKSKEEIKFNENAVVICEKLSEKLGAGVGDKITVKSSAGKTAELTVTGVTENYVSYVVYISPELYAESFGEELKMTSVIAAAYGEKDLRDGLAEKLNGSGKVTSSLYYDEIAASIGESLQSIDTIVLVLIISAALLAFVVLYNLININITERKREIATLKVLGFTGRETYSYMSRETMILAVIGTAVGLVLGIFLHAFVIRTAEVDMVMFAREIELSSFVISAALSILFAVAVNIIMYPKIKSIDMVESLKAGE
ncbi:MAG: ABC transporter permease [Clostridia bacterium]|nr:ABC transporter permease [Clostridia bacterium]